jgi:TPP-dependent pyruvate/acetoin dehydrogenase alpha subunit
MRLFLEKKGLWTETWQREIEGRAKSAIDEAQKMWEAIAPADPKDMFTYTYAGITQRQARQMKDL